MLIIENYLAESAQTFYLAYIQQYVSEQCNKNYCYYYYNIIIIYQTADIEHLQDVERTVKALIQETLWFLNMEKVNYSC